MSLKSIFNVKGWFEGVLLHKVAGKGVKAAVTVIVGFLGSGFFALKVKPTLDSLGVVIDQERLAEGLTILFSGLLAALWNWIKTRSKAKPA